ncbi:MAG: hypothetical protein QGG40_02350, partial [Myxococcota bacterium]|nr:hypothetical protein [Myxococcota bacterium]
MTSPSSSTGDPGSQDPDLGSFSWLPLAAATLLLSILWAGPVLLHPTASALGAWSSEGPGHLWGLWTTAQGLWEHGPLLRVHEGVEFPDGYRAHLVDPVNLLLFLPGYALGGGGATGAVLGWNLLHLGSVTLAAIGCGLLGREIWSRTSASSWSCALLAVSFAFNPYQWGHPFMGRTELLPVAWLPWVLTWWIRAQRSGSRRDAGIAGLFLGLCALGGSYLSVFLLLVVVPVLVWTGLRGSMHDERRERLTRLAVTGGVALLVALPGIWALLAAPPSGGTMGSNTPLPLYGLEDQAQLAWWFRLGSSPSQASSWRWGLGLDQPATVGLVVLALAVLGVIRARDSHLLGARTVAIAGAWALVLGLGWRWNLGSTQLSLPAEWLSSLVPPMASLAHWERIGPLASLFLGVAAGHGWILLRSMSWTSRLGTRASLVLGLGACSLVAADQATWPRAWS